MICVPLSVIRLQRAFNLHTRSLNLLWKDKNIFSKDFWKINVDAENKCFSEKTICFF